MAKEIECKICGSNYHYQTFCPRKLNKPIKSKTPIRPSFNKKSLKQARIKPKSTTSDYKKAIYKLDAVFSLYIRLKDAKNGFVRCVTCGAKDHYKSMHNGHFISRSKIAVRWDEVNCHPQCPDCNVRLKGNLEVYETYMINRYGKEVVDNLWARSRSIDKIPTPVILAKIDEYVDKLKQYTK